MERTKPLFLCCLFWGLHLLSPPAFSQVTEKPADDSPEISLLDRLLREEIPTLEITTNINAVFEDWRRQLYHWGAAKMYSSEEDILEEEIEVRARGKFRSRYCDNPPLKIKLRKKSLADRDLKKWNEFKLVYPCNSEEAYQNYVLKEYLIYRLYNQLTDFSYRVQLVHLTLNDSTDISVSKKYKAFLIEDVEELEDRMNTKKENPDCVAPTELSAAEYTLFQVFQFAIGNTDWFPPTCRNLDLVATKDDRIIPIPYDFDFSGMVAAGYSSPNSEFGLSSVLERYFMGHRKTIEELTPVFEHFQQKKDDLIQTIKSFKHLPARERSEMLRYLRSFYKILNSSEQQLAEIFVHALVEEGISKY